MNIYKYLLKNNITQYNFAKQIGVSQGMVSQWVNGVRPGLKMCIKIEQLTQKRITRKDLRPHDWKENWPEL